MMQNWKLGMWRFFKKSLKLKVTSRLKASLSSLLPLLLPSRSRCVWKMVAFAWFCLSGLNCIKKTICEGANGSEPNDFAGEMTHKQKQLIWQGRAISGRGCEEYCGISVWELVREWECVRETDNKKHEIWSEREGERRGEKVNVVIGELLWLPNWILWIEQHIPVRPITLSWAITTGTPANKKELTAQRVSQVKTVDSRGY